MEEHQKWRAEDFNYTYTPHPEYRTPAQYDSCDWRWCPETPRKGPHPAFWDFVCHAACHWLVDLNLYVATRAYPKEAWRILNSNSRKSNHSTVWNGNLQEPLLFDANFLALGIPASEALQTAWKGTELWPWEPLKDYLFSEVFDAKR